jgi:MFS family permease
MVTPVTSPTAVAAQRSRPVATGLLLGAFLAPSALGMSAAPIALPALGTALHLTSGATAWTLAAYTLTLSVSTALSGRLADLRGPRTPLLYGMILLLAGGVLVAAGPSFATIIAGRLLQGAGAGTAAVLAFAIGSSLHADPDERGRALGTMGAIVGIVSGAGALLGGALTDALSWRAALDLPVLSALFAVFVAHLVPRRAGATRERMDARGGLLALALAAAVVVLLQAPSTGMPWPAVAAATLVAVAAAIGTAVHIVHRPEGFLPRPLVGDMTFALAAGAGFTLFAGYLVIQYAAPRLMLAHDPHLTATRLGLILLPTGVASAAMSAVGGRVAARIPPLRVVTALAGLSTAGLLLAAAAGEWPVPLVLAVAAAVCAFSTGQVILMAAIPQLVTPAHRGIAAGAFQLIFITGGSFGSAAIGGLTGTLGYRPAIAVLTVLPLLGMVAAYLADRHTAS